jgi:hypothetical protein
LSRASPAREYLFSIASKAEQAARLVREAKLPRMFDKERLDNSAGGPQVARLKS